MLELNIPRFSLSLFLQWQLYLYFEEQWAMTVPELELGLRNQHFVPKKRKIQEIGFLCNL